jgi:HEAT repeat protein
MYLYRAKEIRNRDHLKEICLKIINRGDYDQIIEILPHIRILRSGDFFNPLQKLLVNGRPDQKTAATLALGCLGDNQCIPFLKSTYEEAKKSDQFGNQNLRAAVIESLGEIVSQESVGALKELADQSDSKNDPEEFESVISALGQLSQQGIDGAEEFLIELMNSGLDSRLTAHALTEILVAYWHRPSEITDQLCANIVEIASEGSKEVVKAATNSLFSLVQLGCISAREPLEKIEEITSI